ncbi:phospho-sugar mutase [Allosaccharopolyspora coralli]|uniref:Phospho-sugar mutase n=1 Tax=Allosaccharopolyspora coralli TaxID=2665642 RepID=A0A5Q3QKL0_9PSEU|nr:phospho-sugar mutase [Allosaccharopolyspora coralli]QGK71367.1 phospho-sugar mutase [Allosaccharopolyspora coralli]
MTTLDPAVRDAAYRWIGDDVSTDAKAELHAVLGEAQAGSTDAIADLTDRMAGPLAFGTAGLRGPVRAGPNGMNRAVVVRTTAGLASWLQAQGRGGGVVVVGRDARHGSADFAEDTAGVLAAAGFDVRMLPEPLPTPVLAFAVRALDAVAGVQVTASHNPPQDNGYKVYLDAGAQLVSPADREIEAAIEAVGAANTVPSSASWTVHHAAVTDYLDRIEQLPHGSARELRVAATALHGVGAETLVAALKRAGFHDVHLVASQADPDPDFPTVGFPNPEEPGATDELLALASEVGADLAVALDPDADRCALGIPGHDRRWRMLRGDETGVLLGDHVLSGVDRSMHPDPLVATTLVSSTMLGSVAAAYDVRYAETLTGFKWLMRAGDGAGTGLVYAYEEALGHCVDPDHVRDKDGISAAVLACDLAASSGRTLAGLLDALAVEHGVHLTDQVSLRVTDLDVIDRTTGKLRADPPTRLAGTPVTTRDLLPANDILVYEGEGLRVVVRPSGTEPKLKCYLEVRADVDEYGLDSATRTATDRLTTLRQELATLLAP